jgi:hypothetical protein
VLVPRHSADGSTAEAAMEGRAVIICSGAGRDGKYDAAMEA